MERVEILFHSLFNVDKHVTKKNARPILRSAQGRPFIGKDKALKEAETRLLLGFLSAKNEFEITTPFEQDLWLMCIFHYAREDYYTKKNKRKLTLGDLSNHYQIVEDQLEKAGIIKNDSQIQAHDWSRIVPSKHTMLEVILLDYNRQAVIYDVSRGTLDLSNIASTKGYLKSSVIDQNNSYLH